MASVAKFDQWLSTSGIPVNTPIQIATKTVTGRSTTTATTFTTLTDGTTPLSIFFTPRYANSLILIEWMISGVKDGTDIVGWIAPFRDANSLYTNTSTGADGSVYYYGQVWKQTYGSSTDGNVLNTHVGMWTDTAGNTSTREYSMKMKNRGGTFYFNRTENETASQAYSQRGVSMMKVTEIAQ
jgi:hypothetical protein